MRDTPYIPTPCLAYTFLYSLPMAKDEKKSEVLNPIRVTPSEKKAIYKMAESSGQSVSDYVRGTAIPPTKKS